jgi:hypothetical protein
MKEEEEEDFLHPLEDEMHYSIKCRFLFLHYASQSTSDRIWPERVPDERGKKKVNLLLYHVHGFPRCPCRKSPKTACTKER